jgi:hypothetical protein
LEVALSVESVSNFRRDGSRPTAFDVQALIANHFVLLWWKHHGSERQLKASRKVGKVSGKETNESKPSDEASLANQVTSEPRIFPFLGITAEEPCIAVCRVCGVEAA